MRSKIKKLVKQIKPFDDLESEHISNAIKWINSDEEIFRVGKPATPPKHLVSYFVLIDLDKKKLMLVDHVKSGLMLPSGGHVDKDEHPNITVEREIQEELNIDAHFIQKDPFFITQAITVGKTAGHTDVSLWYVLKANSKEKLIYDTREFNGYKWYNFDEILNTDISRFDPHMHRFVKKLISNKKHKFNTY
jgi:8-oxo-dGTP diphosphatase